MTDLIPEELAACREANNAIDYECRPSYESAEELFAAGLSHARAESAKEIAELKSQVEALRKDGERVDAIEKLFESFWNGVIGAGSKRLWRIVSSSRHWVSRMEGGEFRDAIDAAIAQETDHD